MVEHSIYKTCSSRLSWSGQRTGRDISCFLEHAVRVCVPQFRDSRLVLSYFTLTFNGPILNQACVESEIKNKSVVFLIER